LLFKFLLAIAALQAKFARIQRTSIVAKNSAQSLVFCVLEEVQWTATAFHSQIICLLDSQLAIVHKDSAFIQKNHQINTVYRSEAMPLIFNKQGLTSMRLALLEIRTILLVKFILKN